MSIQASSLLGRTIGNYSIYMNTNTQAGSTREPVNFHANNKASKPGDLHKPDEVTECQTCKNRKYVDGSNDPGVSFKTPTKISPQASFSAVSSHEQEHVSRENAKALRSGREVVSQSVRIYTSVCPECGRVYSSGGKTITVTKGEGTKPDYFMDKMNKFFEGHFGQKVDTYV